MVSDYIFQHKKERVVFMCNSHFLGPVINTAYDIVINPYKFFVQSVDWYFVKEQNKIIIL